MKKYQFTGHLSPTPKGMMPLQMSGEVYLAADVERVLREQRRILVNLASDMVCGKLLPAIEPDSGWYCTTPRAERRRINDEIERVLNKHKTVGMLLKQVCDALATT